MARAVIYHPTSPADPYLAVVFNDRGEIAEVTPTHTWREAEAALKRGVFAGRK